MSYNLKLINGGKNWVLQPTYILTFDPNFLKHPSSQFCRPLLILVEFWAHFVPKHSNVWYIYLHLPPKLPSFVCKSTIPWYQVLRISASRPITAPAPKEAIQQTTTWPCSAFWDAFFARWWFQPIWKILYSQIGNLPQIRMKLKIFETTR